MEDDKEFIEHGRLFMEHERLCSGNLKGFTEHKRFCLWNTIRLYIWDIKGSAYRTCQVLLLEHERLCI
jgi:hypothetical protein